MKQCYRLSMIIFLVLSCASLNCAFAQRIEIPSSPNPVGSGARALGMGGAFIAVADDATAASWNPGGLIQLRKPEISIVGEGFHRIEDIAFDHNDMTGGEQSVSETRLNYFSLTSPPFCICGSVNMIFSLNYQHLYDFTREWDFSRQSSISTIDRTDYKWKTDGSLSALGIACSFRTKWLPQWALGVTLNLWEDWLDKNEWKGEEFKRVSFKNDDPLTYHYIDRYSFSGLNANIGLLWDFNGSVKIGAVLKMPFKADIKKSSVYTGPGEDSSTQHVSVFPDEYMSLEMPMSYGIGIAYRISDRFTASLDVYRTEWGDFVLTDSDGEKSSPVTGKSLKESDIGPTHQLRMGFEYLFIWPEFIIPLCGGVFYDPAPAPGSPDDFFGFSIGSGISMEWDKPVFKVKGFTFDIAYQYRFGNNIGSFMLENLDFSQDVEEHTVYSSLIIYF